MDKTKIKKVTIELIGGVEGDSLCMCGSDGCGQRICGPKPWGGGTVKKRWTVRVIDIIEAIDQARKD